MQKINKLCKNGHFVRFNAMSKYIMTQNIVTSHAHIFPVSMCVGVRVFTTCVNIAYLGSRVRFMCDVYHMFEHIY